MNILQICNKVPFPPKDGGCIAMNNLTKGLLNAGHNVKILAINTPRHYVNMQDLPAEYKAQTNIEAVFIDTNVKPVPAFLNLFSSDSYNISRFYSPSFEEKLIAILKKEKYDVVQLESLFVTMYIPAIRKYSKAKVVLRSHNIEHLLWERNALAAKNVLKKNYFSFLAERLKKYELSVIDQFDGVAAITSQDASWFLANGFKKALNVIPFGIDLNSIATNQNVKETERSVFHIGAMDWQPNIDGINWFLDKVWDKVILKHPDVRLYLAGRKMNGALENQDKKNVIIEGEVEDAHDFIRSRGIMIIPLLSGGGMRVKLIEGMSLGKAIVSTSVGAEGVECENDKNILIADTPEAFASAVSECLSDESLTKELGSQAASFASRYYNNADISKKLADFYTSIIQS
jgi:polysaccharide biosynthesis protein PslH